MMSIQEISKEYKQNVRFDCVPFCIERERVKTPDGLHIHDYYQLTIITRGRGTLVANNMSYEISAGNVYFITSFVPHYLRDCQDIELVNILFYLEDMTKHASALQRDQGFQSLFFLLPSMASPERPSNILRLDYNGIQYVNQIVGIMLDELQENRPGREIVVQSYFMILITFFTREYSKDGRAMEDSEAYQFCQIMRHIDNNFCRKYTVDELVQLFGISEKHLRKLFLREYHCTPMQYIINLRLQKARYLLVSSDRSIAEISEAVGFEDSNYFSRKFKQVYGISPREYRAGGTIPNAL